ncbi:unnamed protein product [Amoebophrya sp. A120]|nr:unnamed protein product [Amoebophrya sp. A120]|eukprot:GSA120T00006463001.1
MSLTVRQARQQAPALYNVLQEKGKNLDDTDEIIKFIKPLLRQNQLKLDQLGSKIRLMDSDKNSLKATLNQLDDATTEFESLYVHKLALLISNLHSIAEKIGSTQSLTNSIILEIPHPYFQVLARDYQLQLERLKHSIDACETSLVGYQRERQEALAVNEFQESAVTGRKIEVALRANYAQFRSIAGELLKLEERMEELKQAAQVQKNINLRNLVLETGTSSVSATSMTNYFGNNGVAANMLGGSLGVGQQPGGAGAFAQQPAGTAAQPAIGGGMFGGQSNASLFGQPGAQTQPAATGGGLFGTQPQQPATGGGLFGNTQPQNTSTGGGLFGSTTAQQPANTGGGLFGSTQPAAQNTGGGLFGGQPAQPQNTGGGLFGGQPAQNTGGGLFGSQPAPAQNTGGGLFGNSAGGSIFGGR